MKYIATSDYFTRARGLFLLCLLGLTGCALPRPASTPVVYDFGPGAQQSAPANHALTLPPLEISTLQASTALNSTAVLYRLAYADAQQLKPYTQARWSMAPGQLISQRLREQLSQRRAIVSPGDIIRAGRVRAAAASPATQPESLLNLRLELDEFSQLFASPDQSSGLLRLRATLMQRNTTGDTLLAQRSFVVQQPAPSPDASGGVRALAAATDQVIGEIETWLEQVGR